jgi:hypothetical protein
MQMAYLNPMKKRSEQPRVTAAPSRAKTAADRPQAAAPPPVDNRPPEPMNPAHREAVDEGMAQARQGRFAGDADIEAIYRGAAL